MKRFILSAVILCMTASCGLTPKKNKTIIGDPDVDVLPASNTPLKNCRFEEPVVTYTVGSQITPNNVICDDGLISSAQVISPVPLPGGLLFSAQSLTGTPTTTSETSEFKVYVENSAGYLIVPISITVQ